MAQKFTVFIDPLFDANERDAIGRSIIDYIIDRTKSGKGIGGTPFTNSAGGKTYSKAYQQHRDFEIGGKDNRPINLTLTGDMLDSIEVLDITLPGRIIIGISDGANADKAQFMRDKGYEFLGLSDSEKSRILSKVAKITKEEAERSDLIRGEANTILKGIFRGG